MPFALIALLVALLATAWFAFATDASPGSKVLVVAVCVISLAFRFSFPQWGLVGLLLQAVLVIGVVLYAKIHP